MAGSGAGHEGGGSIQIPGDLLVEVAGEQERVTLIGLERAELPREIPPAPQTNTVRDTPTRKTARSKRFLTNPRSGDASIRLFPKAEFVRPVFDFFVFIFVGRLGLFEVRIRSARAALDIVRLFYAYFCADLGSAGSR